ncbi:MAG: D-alanyl-D-alanine carboxypeptidase family protein [Suilimivivens sp.]
MDQQWDNEEMIRQRRRQRVREMQRRKRKQMLFRRYIRTFATFVVGVMILLILIVTGVKVFHKTDDRENTETEENDSSVINETLSVQIENGAESNIEEDSQKAELPVETEIRKTYSAKTTADTKSVGEDVISKHAILIDLGNDSILAQRDASSIIYPASMTKILTVLVAAENIREEDLDDTFTITIDITDYCYSNDCSAVGFAQDEVVTVRDLFYGTILPSGADAAVGLATYVAGSQEAFVDLMNKRLEELGLSETAHFTNCVGLYNEDHYCTLYDMAMILEAAIDNEFCREVLSAHTYTTSATEQHPEGITISNWFLRRIEDKDTGGEVICGKTGYVVQSGNCAASYGIDAAGKEYLCVTADATSSWRCIYDHVALYKQFATGESEEDVSGSSEEKT